ncbi:MAG: glycosyltransferase family 39 protein, partial [Anaerolineae bacterium]|nr:glycosyltransferase family 39 protein [Anaerolineae bacterium]
MTQLQNPGVQAIENIRVDRLPQINWLVIGLGLALLMSLVLPLNLLSSQRFHHDEALYATWAMQVASGQYPGLKQVPIDKPPLFLYTAAGVMRLLGPTETAARLPSLIATTATVGLTFALGRRLYGVAVGLTAAWLVALSPLAIMLAPTALTDQMLVALVLGAGLLASVRRPGWAGFLTGLALATKQQALFFLPLVMVLLLVAILQGRPLSGQHFNLVKFWGYKGVIFSALLLFLAITAVTYAPAVVWDFTRDQSPGYWRLSAVNYGGLSTRTENLAERWAGFVELLTYGTGSVGLNTVFVVGLPILLGFGYWQLNQAGRLNDRAALPQRPSPQRSPTGRAFRGRFFRDEVENQAAAHEADSLPLAGGGLEGVEGPMSTATRPDRGDFSPLNPPAGGTIKEPTPKSSLREKGLGSEGVLGLPPLNSLYHLPLRLAIAWVWGCGLVTLGLFGLLWLGISLRQSVLLLTLGGLAGWLAIRYANKPEVTHYALRIARRPI